MAETGSKGPVRVSALGIISGLLFGLGLAVLLQQYGVRPMTTGWLILWLVIGILVGIAIPSIAFAVGKSRASKAPKEGSP